MRLALVHDWLTGMRGGEKALAVLCERFPDAELFTLISIPGRMTPAIARLPTHVSWLQRLPAAETKYRSLLPLMPSAISKFDLSG